MKKYQELMMNFSLSSLKGFLGNQIVEMLIEWSPAEKSTLSKERLIGMIDCARGNKIFKDREFRKQLLLSMSVEDILLIRDRFLSGNEKTENDPRKIVDYIVNKSWGKNKISQFLLDFWGVSANILEADNIESEKVSIISNNGDRFYELLDYQFVIKQRALSDLNSGNSQERLMIHMPTGTGKTKTAMHIIVNYMLFGMKNNGIVLWIAHTKELLQQAYDTFVDVWGHLGDGDSTTFRLWGSNNIDDATVPLNGIVFCGLSKLMAIYDGNNNLLERLKKDCRLIVFDEVIKRQRIKLKRL